MRRSRLGSHFGRRAAGQHSLRVAAAAPVRHVLAVLLLQLRRVHAGRRHLHRIDDVDADLDQVGQERLDRAAAVVEDLRLGVALDGLR